MTPMVEFNGAQGHTKVSVVGDVDFRSLEDGAIISTSQPYVQDLIYGKQLAGDEIKKVVISNDGRGEVYVNDILYENSAPFEFEIPNNGTLTVKG